MSNTRSIASTRREPICHRFDALSLGYRLLSIGFFTLFQAQSVQAVSLNDLPIRSQILEKARTWMNEYEVSYAWGGSRLGDKSSCAECNQCIAERQPNPRRQLETCPVCKACSLDCSHFISLVYRDAGLSAPYLTTGMMNTLDVETLESRYGWLSLEQRIERALPGDLLVYDGHVVMVTALSRPGFGNVIHVTAGSEVRGPGQGIQKARNVVFDGFRGPVLRILRHKDLHQEWVLHLRASKTIRPVEP